MEDKDRDRTRKSGDLGEGGKGAARQHGGAFDAASRGVKREFKMKNEKCKIEEKEGRSLGRLQSAN
jgi:hypothetical protein